MQNEYPPYSYVPGGPWPHPKSNPAGHSYGKPEICVKSIEPAKLLESSEMRWAIELFNQGFYWESHEVWESLWHAAGRKGEVADYLKALIKLAAAGVKVREGLPAGVRSHASGSARLLNQLASSKSAGLSQLSSKIQKLADFAETLAQHPEVLDADNLSKPVLIVFDMKIDLSLH